MAKPRTGKSDETVKTTIELPEHLWRAAKIRAVENRTDLRRVVIDALEAFLTKEIRR